MNILLLGSGQIEDYDQVVNRLSDSYGQVIAVDGGAEHLEKLNIQPTLLVGDFDSISRKTLQRYADIKHIIHPPEKDDTDSALALQMAVEFEPSRIDAIGFTGSRWDHTMANLMLIAKYPEQNIYLFDENNVAFLCKPTMEFNVPTGHYLSLIPLNSISSLSISGVKYPLVEKNLEWPTTLTLSNEAIDERVHIQYREGTCIVMFSRD
jgi:thiamine pyrophosphokinase